MESAADRGVGVVGLFPLSDPRVWCLTHGRYYDACPGRRAGEAGAELELRSRILQAYAAWETEAAVRASAEAIARDARL